MSSRRKKWERIVNWVFWITVPMTLFEFYWMTRYTPSKELTQQQTIALMATEARLDICEQFARSQGIAPESIESFRIAREAVEEFRQRHDDYRLGSANDHIRAAYAEVHERAHEDDQE